MTTVGPLLSASAGAKAFLPLSAHRAASRRVRDEQWAHPGLYQRQRRHLSASISQTRHDTLNGPFNILFAGSDSFARVALQAIVNATDIVSSIHVLTPPSAEKRRAAQRMQTSPVTDLAEQLGLAHQTVPSSGFHLLDLPPPFAEDAPKAPDNVERPAPLLVTVSFGHFIPPLLLSRLPTPSHCLNLHPSMLPSLRGAAPIQWALAKRLKSTGVTVQQLSPDAYDRGNILAQEEALIPTGSTYLELEQRLAEQGSKLLVDTIRNLPSRHANARPQDDSLATYAVKVRRHHVDVRWDCWSAEVIEARSRAFGYLYPLDSTMVSLGTSPAASSRVIFPSIDLLSCTTRSDTSDARIHELLDQSDVPAGTAILSRPLSAIVIKCAPRSEVDAMSPTYALVPTLKTSGKREMPAAEWWKGYHDRADKEGRIRFERGS